MKYIIFKSIDVLKNIKAISYCVLYSVCAGAAFGLTVYSGSRYSLLFLLNRPLLRYPFEISFIVGLFCLASAYILSWSVGFIISVSISGRFNFNDFLFFNKKKIIKLLFARYLLPNLLIMPSLICACLIFSVTLLLPGEIGALITGFIFGILVAILGFAAIFSIYISSYVSYLIVAENMHINDGLLFALKSWKTYLPKTIGFSVLLFILSAIAYNLIMFPYYLLVDYVYNSYSVTPNLWLLLATIILFVPVAIFIGYILVFNEVAWAKWWNFYFQQSKSKPLPE